MDEQQLAERLSERAVCEAEHADLRLPHNGFMWTGTRCSRCGFAFFGEWDYGPSGAGQA